MRIRKHVPRLNISRLTNQYPWGPLTKLFKLKKRKWARYEFNRRALIAPRNQILSYKLLRTYRDRTRLIFRRFFGTQLTLRQTNKLFRSNPRYKATFKRVLSSEYRLDTLIYRLYMLPNVGIARDLISRGFFYVNDQVVILPRRILGIGDIVEPKTKAVWDAMYKSLISNIASTTKYYNRLFFKFSFPFVVKRRNYWFKESRGVSKIPLSSERITRRIPYSRYPKLKSDTKSITRPVRGYIFRRSAPAKKTYYFKRIKLRTAMGLAGPLHRYPKLGFGFAETRKAWELLHRMTSGGKMIRANAYDFLSNNFSVFDKELKQLDPGLFSIFKKRRYSISESLELIIKKKRPRVGFWRAFVPPAPENPWQWKRIDSKNFIIFNYLKKFNNRYGIYARHAKLNQVSWRYLGSNLWTKTNKLYDKKVRRLLSVGNNKGVSLIQDRCPALDFHKTFVFGRALVHNPAIIKRIVKIKRKYLRLKGFHSKLGNWNLRVDLANPLYEPIQISYKQIHLNYKHRPIAYYFAEMNYRTLDFCIIADVDLLFFPYRTLFDFKSLPR